MTRKDSAAGFSAEERKAMKERAAELKAEARRAKGAEKAAAEAAELRERIAQMPDGDRELAERVHEIVTSVAPDLAPKLYYGQPGYARDGKVVVFFRSGQMDKERYSTFGVSVQAALDDPSGLWPTSYALTDPSEEAWGRLTEIVRRAAGDAPS
ncbi:uncharacterized protein YdhG (YjbR/CyaY superfamily) [Microbacterium ginsengiterrae]|uniref:Uncharacterized protein YdhG (YjbR/CyaY superfamily) n=1 Tax=Microbacterium ginsengiterrae TaxID=546115 RepID=A0A7W9C9Q2_9MICO|nr:DUF1801 domain-containing protein [Microbacterium ginsengiterrae]MBB5741631.1 uncharacterized protein YdhG (YjbR/CyaY superfamily) [Microbacterium ginsengiterrae]